MKDDKILLIPSEQDYKNHPDHHANHHHHHHPEHYHHMRKRCLFIGTVMAATIFISYIIVLGSSFGIHQKSSLIHGNNIINSSIIINIIVDGNNRNRSLIDQLMEDGDSDYDISDDENKNESDILRLPLRVENIDQIPILRDMFEKATTSAPDTDSWTPDTDLY